jgi:uncharacterized protein YbjT (DUF2867 family)
MILLLLVSILKPARASVCCQNEMERSTNHGEMMTRIGRSRSLLLLLVLLVAHPALALATMPPKKVLVTGAGGKTGQIVLQKLLARPALFTPVGLVRTHESQERLVKEKVISAANDAPNSLVVADIVGDNQALLAACRGMDAVIICTSATPAPTGEMTPEGRPVFGYPNGQPELVDWIGQKNQIDAAKAAGVSHVVICSSMGGTDPENGLNKLGRGADGTGGNILLWKRKAEKYLIDSGMTYTIVHPGGLLNEAGGVRELVVGVNDENLGTANRSIPRADVAELLVASIEHDIFKNRSFDVRSKPEGDGTVTTDFGKLLSDLKGNSDYSIGKIPE